MINQQIFFDLFLSMIICTNFVQKSLFLPNTVLNALTDSLTKTKSIKHTYIEWL